MVSKHGKVWLSGFVPRLMCAHSLRLICLCSAAQIFLCVNINLQVDEGTDPWRHCKLGVHEGSENIRDQS